MIARLPLIAMAASFSFGQYLRGVNLTGAEFGENHIPGTANTDYTFNSQRSFQYFAARNLPLMRISFLWERMQPVLSGPLDPAYLASLKSNVTWARLHGNRVIIEPHNFGRYKINEGGKLNVYVIDNPSGGVVKVSGSDFADFWTRLSNEFKDEPAVYAYDLMNEPHDMGAADWKLISQAAVAAIRNNGDTKLIMVPGNGWSGAYAWVANNGPTPWISDPANNHMYEAHQYFDRDNSGSYQRTYDQELAGDSDLPTVGRRRVAVFIDWCRRNNVRGYLGEYGIPNTDPRWLTVLENFLVAVDEAGMDGTYWAAGEWWGNYPLSVQPQDSFTVDRPQLSVLLRHLAPVAFTTVSAASFGGIAFAPGSLVTGFGAKLEGIREVEIADSTGAGFKAPVLWASENQINYLLPAEAAAGKADVVLRRDGQIVGSGIVWLEEVAPYLFSTAQIVRLRPDGSMTVEPAGQPIAFGNDRLFLVLYGTGLRGASATALQVGAQELPVLYAGKQSEFPGLDQVNAELPRALAGAVQAEVKFQADGKPANTIFLTFSP